MNETSSQAIYRQVCEGDPIAVTYYLKTADPEDANHGILQLLEDIEGDRNFYLTERDRLQAEAERLRAYADAETDKLRDALRRLDEQTLPPQRSVLHLYRAEEDGRIHFESESGNHVVMTAEKWAELGEPNAVTIGIWGGVL